MSNQQIIERAAGIAATFVLFRFGSRLFTGISSPGTAAALVATAGAASCRTSSAGLCKASALANKPGNMIGTAMVRGGQKLLPA